MGNFILSIRSFKRLEGVDQRLIDLSEYVIKHTPVDFMIGYRGGLRTEAEQNEIFKAGNSTKDGSVKKSKHQMGLAIDFVPFENGKVTMDKISFMMIVSAFFFGASVLGIKIRSGSNWDGDEEWLKDQNFQDMGHIELK